MRIVWRIFSGIVKWSWRLLNFVREFILNLFLILLILVGVGIYFQLQTPQKDPIKGALLVDLSGTIVEQPKENGKLQQVGRALLGTGDARQQENSLFDLVKTLRQAKNDKNITGMVLALNDFAGADQPSLQYVGKALREFRDSGKPIYAVGDSYNQSQYYLASFANKIILSPQGAVDLKGFASNNLYYKSLLEKLDVSTHIFRVGTYKSAVEPMIRDDMSPEARASDQRWLSVMWQNYLTPVAANRQISEQQLFPGADNIVQEVKSNGGNFAQFALNNKLVDELASRPQAEQELIKQFGWNAKDQTFNATSIYDYTPSETTEKGDKIAIIVVNGAIMDGEKTASNVGGDSTAEQIRKARLDKTVKAVVLRVNSPGGSVTASEVIRAELEALRKSNKPVVVSMGGLAASGGYWISTPANYIIASPSTLTGSIGIFGVINTFENTLNSIGVHSDGVATSPLANVNATQALPSAFSQLMQTSVENGYTTFINIVAEARKKTPAEVDQIAQGRVWIGVDAKQNGLVDQLGDFDDAVNKAAQLAKMEQWQVSWYDSDTTLSTLLFGQMGAQIQALLPQPLINMLPVGWRQTAVALRQQADLLQSMNDPQNRYVLCLDCGDVR